jgi:hypothetical protein
MGLSRFRECSWDCCSLDEMWLIGCLILLLAGQVCLPNFFPYKIAGFVGILHHSVNAIHTAPQLIQPGLCCMYVRRFSSALTQKPPCKQATNSNIRHIPAWWAGPEPDSHRWSTDQSANHCSARHGTSQFGVQVQDEVLDDEWEGRHLLRVVAPHLTRPGRPLSRVFFRAVTLRDGSRKLVAANSCVSRSNIPKMPSALSYGK